MGKKYIIELEDKMFHKTGEAGAVLWRAKGFNSLVFDMTGIDKLTPYTEPDLEQVRKEAYQQGYEQGYKGGYNEPGKGKIQVGDEVITASGKAVVIGVGPVHFEYVFADGSTDYDKVKNAKKTGRTFPEIAEVLRKMRENNG